MGVAAIVIGNHPPGTSVEETEAPYIGAEEGTNAAQPCLCRARSPAFRGQRHCGRFRIAVDLSGGVGKVSDRVVLDGIFKSHNFSFNLDMLVYRIVGKATAPAAEES